MSRLLLLPLALSVCGAVACAPTVPYDVDEDTAEADADTDTDTDVDVDTDTEVGRVDVVGDVEVTLSFGDVLAMGASYRVDFYADLDGNGEYTPPVGGPAASFPDHQWSIDGATAADGSAGLDGVSGDVSITFGHNADWVDIDWPGMEANG